MEKKRKPVDFRPGDRVRCSKHQMMFYGEVLDSGVEDPFESYMVRSDSGLTFEVHQSLMWRVPHISI